MNIVFMGTPDFAVPTLKALINSNHCVVAVFTQPDKKKGRGHHMLPPAVKVVALDNNIPVFQPITLKSDESFEQVKMLNPDLIVVVAYGKILPKCILDFPQYGCINVHASLLPKYRGAAPIQWSVLNGDSEGGVTTMYMAEGLDTGDILLKSATSIGTNETASELHDRLAIIGADLLIKTIEKLNTIKRIPQDDSLSCYAPMLSKELSQLDFAKPAIKLHRQICGLSTWPCASFSLNAKKLKVYKSEVCLNYGEAEVGELLSDREFVVGCGGSTVLKLVEVQYEGSKRMGGSDFMRGQRLSKGSKLV